LLSFDMFISFLVFMLLLVTILKLSGLKSCFCNDELFFSFEIEI
jgi:hypothetical protein